MATLLQSLASCTYFVDCGVTNSSRLNGLSGVLSRNRFTNSFNERKLIHGQAVPPFRNTSLGANATPRPSIESFKQIFTASNKIEESDKVAAYRFRTQVGGVVSVLIRKKYLNCVVRIEVSSLELPNNDRGRLALDWGLYAGDSSADLASEARLQKSSLGRFFVELEVEAKHIPCYLSFRLRSLVNTDTGGVEIRSHRETNFCVPLGFGSGHPTPLGLSFSHDGSVNFSIFSRNAKSVVLCLYGDIAAENPSLELDLDPYVNRTGDLWHASFQSPQAFARYGYRVRHSFPEGSKDKSEGKDVLLDPYSKMIVNSGRGKYLGRIQKEPVFDWGHDAGPNLPMEKLMMYRLSVKRFTEHKSSQLPPDIAGTFFGLSEKLEHLKYLGVNAILLEPIFPFDEQNGPYSPRHFFSPASLYGPSGDSTSAIDSMKEMIKKMHANGIEVILEVVFTHTAESGALEGLDDSTYYLDRFNGRAALNCNFPVVQQFILDSLRHWVTEFHVDGFCFVNSSSLLRGSDGNYLSRPPLIEAISFDPLLSRTKIIADWWDPRGTVSMTKTLFPHWKRWAEMNTGFCDDIKNFLRGEGLLSSLATRLCGSGDVFSEGRDPSFSLNFITSHHGLPLVDHVCFSAEELSSELSWNCGEEGPTNEVVVLEKRIKQIHNFLFSLYVSLGVPVLNMGDECGQSTGGSLAYSSRKPYDWNSLKTGFGIQVSQFIAFLSLLRRRRSDVLQKKKFWKEENINWRGSDGSPPRWEEPTCKFLAMRLRAEEEKKGHEEMESDSDCIEGDVFVAFNAADCSESVVLPRSEEGIVWHRLIDTALPFPGFFSVSGEPVVDVVQGILTYEMKPLSCILLEAKVE